MRKKRLWDACLLILVCTLLSYRFIFYDMVIADNNQASVKTEMSSTETDNVDTYMWEKQTNEISAVINDESMISLLPTEQEKGIWEKISLRASGGIEGIEVHDYGIEVRQDDWVYVVKGAEISKTRKETWDFVPDYDKYEYDEQENLINEYSYVSVLVNITRVDTERHSEGYVNSIWLGIFDEAAERVGGGEVRTADLHNPHTSSYFCHAIELGESRDIEIVYVIDDCDLHEENYYLIKVNNRGVTPEAPDHISLVKIPLGKSVEN